MISLGIQKNGDKYTFKKDGVPDGSIEIIAMPSNPDSQDSFNCNFAIADEVAAYRKPAQYKLHLERDIISIE